MKSNMFIPYLLIVGAFFFHPTDQFNLSKRELTEYDLTNFIVNTCSAEKIDVLIQNLCEQTLQSALMGNFPFLIYYCKTIGIGLNYCNNINRYTIVNEDTGAKRSVSRRRVRSFQLNNKFSQLTQDMDIKNDFDIKLIMQTCMRKIEKNSIDAIEFCNRTLKDRYLQIESFCRDHSDIDYCQFVRSYSSLFSWPKSSTGSISNNMKTPSNFKNPIKSADIDSIKIDQQSINRAKEGLSSTPTPSLSSS